MRTGYGPLLGIELKGGEKAGRQLIDNLKMIYHVANIGDSRTLAIHPASTTHSQLNETEQLATGVTPGYVRFSVGIEHIDDIIAMISSICSIPTENLTYPGVTPVASCSVSFN